MQWTASLSKMAWIGGLGLSLSMSAFAQDASEEATESIDETGAGRSTESVESPATRPAPITTATELPKYLDPAIIPKQRVAYRNHRSVALAGAIVAPIGYAAAFSFIVVAKQQGTGDKLEQNWANAAFATGAVTAIATPAMLHFGALRSTAAVNMLGGGAKPGASIAGLSCSVISIGTSIATGVLLSRDDVSDTAQIAVASTTAGLGFASWVLGLIQISHNHRKYKHLPSDLGITQGRPKLQLAPYADARGRLGLSGVW